MSVINLPGVKITVKSDIMEDPRNVDVEVAFRNGHIDEVHLQLDPSEENIQKGIIKKLLYYYTELEYFPRKGIDKSTTYIFKNAVKMSKDEFELTDRELEAPDVFIGNRYSTRRREFDTKELPAILDRLKRQGFDVDLDENENFTFRFKNRRQPLSFRLPNQGKHSNMNALLENTDMVEFYDYDYIVNQLDDRLRPRQGRNYVKRYLDTYDEFKGIMRRPLEEVEKKDTINL